MLGLNRFKTNFLKLISGSMQLFQDKRRNTKRSQSMENNFIISKYKIYTGEKIYWWQLILRL